ncbi:hypothetical protein LCGC14_0852240 [marine sediment metagenome]|uniref:Uncharacterized protein n=1 Tax=marine sediment metagenome TaxID=412755 RepID=A0A0F9RUI4_9ZZZZ
MAREHWVDRVVAMVEEAKVRMRASMGSVVSRPVGRRPNTKVLMEQAMMNPQALDPTGRATLAQFLIERYGERAAQDIIPYLGIPEEEEL